MAANKLSGVCGLCDAWVDAYDGMMLWIDGEPRFAHVGDECDRPDGQRFLLVHGVWDADPTWREGATAWSSRGWVTILRVHTISRHRQADQRAFWVRTAGPAELAAADLARLEVTR